MNEKYQRYLADMEKFGASKPWMDEKEYLIAIGEYEDETAIALVITPKYTKPFVEPTLEGNIKGKRPSKPRVVRTAIKPKAVIEVIEPKQRYVPPKIYTDEELKQRRIQARRLKRAENKKLGLTVDGKPRKPRKAPKSIEEIRASRLVYTKTWRSLNREQHLQYRRDYRKKKKEDALCQTVS
jgi:hypothetical protein